MQIKSRDRREGGRERVTLVPESLDDIWHLSYVLEPGDLVSGHTTRRIQRNDDAMRDTGGQRESMQVAIEVESVEFHKFANRLRVGGTIVECPIEDQKGLHHTINIEENDEIVVEKVFKTDQTERLEEAAEATENPDVAIVTVEEAQAYIHTVAQYGTEEYASIAGPTGKGEYARSRSELFEDLTDALRHLDVDAIVLAGPGFTKQDALDFIEEEAPEIAEKIQTVDTSAVGDRGVHEVLKRGAVEEIQAETRIASEADFIDDLLKQIATGEKATYGIEEVGKAAEFGAIERLLVLDDRLRMERGEEGEWDRDVDDIIELVEQQGGDVTVFSGDFEPGEQLSQLGGIAALLRFRMN